MFYITHMIFISKVRTIKKDRSKRIALRILYDELTIITEKEEKLKILPEDETYFSYKQLESLREDVESKIKLIKEGR